MKSMLRLIVAAMAALLLVGLSPLSMTGSHQVHVQVGADGDAPGGG